MLLLTCLIQQCAKQRVIVNVQNSYFSGKTEIDRNSYQYVKGNTDSFETSKHAGEGANFLVQLMKNIMLCTASIMKP